MIDELGAFGVPESVAGEASRALWREVRDVVPLAAGGRGVWRLSTAAEPRRGAAPGDPGDPPRRRVLRLVRRARLGRDRSGGRRRRGPTSRAAVARVGGHATLMRAPDAVRAAVPPFEPESAALARLAALTKAAFDPAGVLNPGRMTPAH